MILLKYVFKDSLDGLFFRCDYASDNLEKHGKHIPLRQYDFRYLQQAFPETFDAVVCLTTSLPHLHTDEDLVTALTSMKDTRQTVSLC